MRKWKQRNCRLYQGIFDSKASTQKTVMNNNNTMDLFAVINSSLALDKHYLLRMGTVGVCGRGQQLLKEAAEATLKDSAGSP